MANQLTKVLLGTDALLGDPWDLEGCNQELQQMVRTAAVRATALAHQVLGSLKGERGVSDTCPGSHAETEGNRRDVPEYQARTLRWRGLVVKRLKRAAPAQEPVLEAFQAKGWPESVEDPLEADEWMDQGNRLRQTVRSLNEGLMEGTIWFHADGTGRGIRWEALG